MNERRGNSNTGSDGLRNNRIAIMAVLAIGAVGAIYYGVTSYMAPPLPVAHSSAPALEPTGQGPGTPGRP
jgi:hypothetical protein